MKILVISDSHDRSDIVVKCIRENYWADAVIHLGDCTYDLEEARGEFPSKLFYSVRGNNDYMSDSPLVREEVFDGVKIYMTHGHRAMVNYSLDTLMGAARRRNAQICLFGHTHVPYNAYVDGLYVMNPGSLCYPRGGSKPGFGRIDITPQGISVNTTDFSFNRWW